MGHSTQRSGQVKEYVTLLNELMFGQRRFGEINATLRACVIDRVLVIIEADQRDGVAYQLK